MQHLGYEPSHFLAFLHLLHESCTMACVFDSRHVNAGREEGVADAAPVFTASLCNETGKTELPCSFIQDCDGWSLGRFIRIGKISCFLPLRFICLKGMHTSPLTHDACVAPVCVPYILRWGSCHRVVTSFWHQSTKGLCLALTDCWQCECSIFLW